MTRARTTVPYLVLALFVAAGGYVHLREWLDHYRYVPSAVPGAFVVKVGFPLDSAASLVLAIALTVIAFHTVGRIVAMIALASTAMFEAASLAALILTRTGSVFGWSEQVWTTGASQSRAVEIGALLAVAAIAALDWVPGRSEGPSAVPSTPGV
jgi:hypothetical protein